MVIHYSVAQEVYGMKRYFKTPINKVVDAFVGIFFEGMERRKRLTKGQRSKACPCPDASG
ncbi:MAG: hypothetical protein HY878_05210 [Deltaproteobacteria bacterium]|nr:hypothetical protein [Deltaproteobacteria bacterium]